MEDELEKRIRRVGDELAANRKAVATTVRAARKVAAIGAEAGISHRHIAELLGVDRMTVRKWVGKR